MQDPMNTQNFNRYGYVLNNPLKYTDPTGEFGWSDLVAVFEVVVGTVLLFTPAAALGGALLSAGLYHFASAYSLYQQNGGNWNAASTSAGNFFSYSFTTDWGYGNNNNNNSSSDNTTSVNNNPVETHNYSSSGTFVNPNANSGNSLYNIAARADVAADKFGKFAGSLIASLHPAVALYDAYVGHTTGHDIYNQEMGSAGVALSIISVIPMGKATIVAKEGIAYMKSTLKMGQEVHAAYHFGEFGKEFPLPSGKRIDFLDILNNKIFELKPFNKRALKAGQKQLDMYEKELRSMIRFKDIEWEQILDTY